MKKLLFLLFLFPFQSHAAIAYDSTATNYAGSGTTISITHTSSGSDRIVWCGVLDQQAVDPGVTSVTYDGVAMTGIASNPANNGGVNNVHIRLYYLIAPNTGGKTVTATFAGSVGNSGLTCSSYTGASQTGVPDAQSKTENFGATTSCVGTVTTVADNSWMVMFVRTEIGGATFHTGTTNRYNNTDGGFGDSGGPITPAGSHSLQYDFGSSVNDCLVASFAPVSTGVVSKFHLWFLSLF